MTAVRKKGIRVIFLSNRMNENLKPTRSNLKSLGVLDPRDLFLLREDKSDTKQIRRTEVMNGTGRMKKVGLKWLDIWAIRWVIFQMTVWLILEK